MKWVQRTPQRDYFDWDNITEQLACIRGINDVNDFLNPSQFDLHNPYLLDSVENASNRIIKAIKRGEKIAISADVDADGITSVALLVRYIKRFTENYYITYHQRSEGHGIQNQLDQITDDTNLFIVLDSSSNERDICKSISEKGIDIVIIDHHEITTGNPYCILVNPQKENCSYPNKNLSAAAIVYKVIQVMDDSLLSGGTYELLDLVATSLVADMMSQVEPENRFLIHTGLQNINNPGIKAILKAKKADLKNLNSNSIAFTVAPLLNGATRMDKIKHAIDILLSDNPVECKQLAKEIMRINEERKQREVELTKELIPQVNLDDKVIIAITENASVSFNGLLASKISQEYQRPAMVLRKNKNNLRGSYRSYGDFRLREFLNGLDFVEFAEGHEFAGGTGLKVSKLNDLKELINEKLSEVTYDVTLEYDLDLDVNSITQDLVKQVENFNRIAGKDFPVIKFLVKNAKIMNRTVIGKNKDTIKIECKNGLVLMKFRVDESWGEDIQSGENIDVVGQINLNEFYHGGLKKFIRTNQVFIDDYKINNVK